MTGRLQLVPPWQPHAIKINTTTKAAAMMVGPNASTRSPKLTLSRRRFSFTTTSLCTEHARRAIRVLRARTDRGQRFRPPVGSDEPELSANESPRRVKALAVPDAAAHGALGMGERPVELS